MSEGKAVTDELKVVFHELFVLSLLLFSLDFELFDLLVKLTSLPSRDPVYKIFLLLKFVLEV